MSPKIQNILLSFQSIDSYQKLLWFHLIFFRLQEKKKAFWIVEKLNSNSKFSALKVSNESSDSQIKCGRMSKSGELLWFLLEL